MRGPKQDYPGGVRLNPEDWHPSEYDAPPRFQEPEPVTCMERIARSLERIADQLEMLNTPDKLR